MSAPEHRAKGEGRRARALVLVISTSRSLDDDRSGRLIVEKLAGAGHTVLDRRLVTDDAAAIGQAVDRAVAEAEVVVLTGGTGLAPSDVTPEALEPRFSRRIDGFGELFRMLSWEEVGAAAMLSRAVAGMIGPAVVFALPGSSKACALAMDRLVVPELPHLLGLLSRPDLSSAADAGALSSATDAHPAAADRRPAPSAPPTSSGLTLRADHASSTAARSGEPPSDLGGDQVEPGWTRAVRDLGGTVERGRREPLPEPVASLAPLVELLQGAGETGVLELARRAADGSVERVRYSLWGWPDLRRPQSKVLAVGWGEPLAEVLALHRWPRSAGTCVEGGGVLEARSAALAQVVLDRLGRPAPREGGTLFAVASDAVWVERGGQVVEWDGRRERGLGTMRQALVSLALRWSQR